MKPNSVFTYLAAAAAMHFAPVVKAQEDYKLDLSTPFNRALNEKIHEYFRGENVRITRLDSDKVIIHVESPAYSLFDVEVSTNNPEDVKIYEKTPKYQFTSKGAITCTGTSSRELTEADAGLFEKAYAEAIKGLIETLKNPNSAPTAHVAAPSQDAPSPIQPAAPKMQTAPVANPPQAPGGKLPLRVSDLEVC